LIKFIRIELVVNGSPIRKVIKVGHVRLYFKPNTFVSQQMKI